MPTSDDELQPLVAASYLALGDLLAGMGAAAWETRSMCEGWRVREVVAHVTMPARYDEEAFMAELRECGFDFTTLSNRVAARDAELPTEQLVANLRDEVMQHWTPPGGGYHGALSHVVIHGLDVTAPLGVERCSSDPAVRVVLDDLASGGAHSHFGTELGDRTLQATDLDWSYGSGPVVSATAGDLVLHLTGRRVPTERLVTRR